jgi:hypothetical protein
MENHEMNSSFTRLLVLPFLMATTSLACADSITQIDTYGVYVADKSGYVKVEPYTHDYRFVDFKYLNEIPVAERKDDNLTLVVYAKDFSPNSVQLESRPLQVKVQLEKINFSVKPLDKPDMYELTTSAPVKDGTILHVEAWGTFDNFGAIVLGETEDELIKYFSQKTLSNASVVTQYLDDALVAFPDNAKLKELSLYWKTAAEEEKDKSDYAYVEEKWQQYEAAEKLTLKERYLNAVIGEINGYLSQHPEGIKANEAKERKATAEAKLKEYEKLL